VHAPAASRGVDDVQFARDLVADRARGWNVDRTRVFATGHSSGGMPAYRLGVEAPDLVRAIAPNAAALGVGGAPTAPVPVLALHGRREKNIRWQDGVGSGVSGADFRGQREGRAPFLQANGCSAPLLAETRGAAQRWTTGAPLGAPVEAWWMDVYGHAWPGHGSGLPRREPCNYDLDANAAIWVFFARF
jgi:polyhydroxybutyrate depolymerase